MSRLSEKFQKCTSYRFLPVPLYLIVLTFIIGMAFMFLFKIELARDKMHINWKAFLQIKMLRVFKLLSSPLILLSDLSCILNSHQAQDFNARWVLGCWPSKPWFCKWGHQDTEAQGGLCDLQKVTGNQTNSLVLPLPEDPHFRECPSNASLRGDWGWCMLPM